MRLPKWISSFSLAGILVVSLCLPAFATPAQEARATLVASIDQVLQELNKPGLHQAEEQKAILQRIEDVIRGIFDFEELSARTVGPGWKKFSPDQKTRFIAEFSDLLRETYLEKLNGYNGETVSYKGEQTSTAGDKVEVLTSINIKAKDVPVSYRMIKKNGWVVYDMVIEGISMVQNYRSQFQDLLLKGDVEALIRQVGAKAQETRAYNKKQQVTS